MRVLIFTTTLSEIFLIVTRIRRDIITHVRNSPCKVPVVLVRFLMTVEFSRQIFEKFSNIKFHENTSRGSRVVLYRERERERDRQT